MLSIKNKRVVACDTSLDYEDSKEEFKIHTNAIDFQLEVIIIYKVKPIAFLVEILLMHRKGIYLQKSSF